LGIHINQLLETYPKAKHSIKDILAAELELQEQSKLINQILETHKALRFDEILNSIENINNQLKL